MAQQNGDSLFPSMPFDPSIFHSRNTPSSSSLSSLRHPHHLLSQTSTTQNPYSNTQDIESLFSRLNVDAPLGSVLNRPFMGTQASGVQDYDMALQFSNLNHYSGVNSSAYLGLPPDYCSTSTSSILENFVNDSVQFPWRGGIISNGLPSKPPRNSSKPYWLQEEPCGLSALEYNYMRGPLSLYYLMGNIVRLAKDQKHCRLVQKALDNVTPEETHMVLLEIIDSICELMPHPFGNFVVQKLVEVCTEEQRLMILLAITETEKQLFRICLDVHGTRALMKLLESIATHQGSVTSRQQVSVVMSAISRDAIDFAKDTNGHHIIKYCLDHFLPEDYKYLLRVVAHSCFDIATDKSGCCILQYCVDLSSGDARDLLVVKITEIALPLAHDRYGNYVVQHLLGLRIPEITASLLRQLEGSFVALACDKYGSNVVEKCLVDSRVEQSTQIVLELLRSSSFPMLLVHPYGNFVIQSALKISKGLVLRLLLKVIGLNIPRMRSNMYGKKVIYCLQKERLIPEI
ncbi:pumilio homolog 12-like [Mercurialis annua]|uniref:pumilio homolog 12-like n=1 Tax=Mercurialis annua TaxID=3986 RepID=UPI00215DDD8A|nr:pumilio homolog 12-like [Mercurialis annua]